MKHDAPTPTTEVMSDECLGLFLEEAERAILIVEGRADDPGRRVMSGDVAEPEDAPAEVGELRLAIAELVDAHPSTQYDLELIGERARNVGARAGSGELESHPHVLDLVRLSLEVFVRLYPDADAYEIDQRRRAESAGGDDGASAAEHYETLRQLLDLLRSRIS